MDGVSQPALPGAMGLPITLPGTSAAEDPGAKTPANGTRWLPTWTCDANEAETGEQLRKMRVRHVQFDCLENLFAMAARKSKRR